MKRILTRNNPEMLSALSTQSVFALFLNALTRGALFVLVIQLISFAGGLVVNNAIQILFLAVLFSMILFAFNFLEKYWAQARLKKLK